MSFGAASLLLSSTWETNYATTSVPIPNLPSPSVGPIPNQHAASTLIRSPGQLSSLIDWLFCIYLLTIKSSEARSSERKRMMRSILKSNGRDQRESGSYMRESRMVQLRSILDDFESGNIDGSQLNALLSLLSPEELGWIAWESIQRSKEVAKTPVELILEKVTAPA